MQFLIHDYTQTYSKNFYFHLYLHSQLNKQCPHINYIRFMKKQMKHHTQQNLDKDLDRMLFLAAEEKLLPKIIYDYSFQHQSPKFANKYRQSVKEIYTKETALPLKYNEDDAKTHREKFRQKVIKLINNELPVDYLRPIKINGKYIMTYKGQPLERVQYPTKTEYTMFSQYSENKFKTSFESVFDDKLEYTQKQLISNPRKDLTLRNKTQPNGQFREKKQQSNETTTTKQTQSKQLISYSTPASLPKLLPRSQFDKNRLASPKILPKKKPKRPKLINQQALILATMMKIGKYSNGSTNSISVTKQSIIKYFKQFYLRPHRIVDFLEFSDVETYNSFSKVPQRLKFMPNEHIYFMAFLFYDSNNDGYICNNDLIRMEQLIKKCPLIKQDHDLIRTGAQKIKFENKIEYQQLYRLSQVTETTYFNWLKKEKIDESNPESEQYNVELKQYFEYLNKRKIQVHYEGFKKIFENQKPYLYYDLVWRISGVKYEGLKYQ